VSKRASRRIAGGPVVCGWVGRCIVLGSVAARCRQQPAHQVGSNAGPSQHLNRWLYRCLPSQDNYLVAMVNCNVLRLHLQPPSGAPPALRKALCAAASLLCGGGAASDAGGCRACVAQGRSLRECCIGICIGAAFGICIALELERVCGRLRGPLRVPPWSPTPTHLPKLTATLNRTSRRLDKR
jgi:hypothetical protein